MDPSLGPIYTALFSSPTWFYIDRSGYERGPFRPDEMYAWYSGGYFPSYLAVRPNKRSIFRSMAELQIGNDVQSRGKREWENENDSVERDSKIIKKEEQVSFPNSKQELKETIDAKDEYIEVEIKDERDTKNFKDEFGSRQDFMDDKLYKDEYTEAEIKDEWYGDIGSLEKSTRESKEEISGKVEIKRELIKASIKVKRDSEIKKEEFKSLPNLKQEFKTEMSGKIEIKKEYIEPDGKFEGLNTLTAQVQPGKMANYQGQDGKKEGEQRRIFVWGLNSTTTEQTLKSHFSQYGKVVNVSVKKTRKRESSRGFGIVTYEEQDQVDACQDARPHVLDGELVVTRRRSEKRRGPGRGVKKLFVEGLQDDLEDSHLQEYFRQFGHVVTVTRVTETKSGQKRGFGFVEFDDYDTVDKIILRGYHEINGKKVVVKNAAKQRKGGGGGWGASEGGQEEWGQDQGYGVQGSFDGQGGHGGGGWEQGSWGGGYIPAGGYEGGSLCQISTPQALSGQNHVMENLFEISVELPSHLPSSTSHRFPLEKTPYLFSSAPSLFPVFPFSTPPPQTTLNHSLSLFEYKNRSEEKRMKLKNRIEKMLSINKDIVMLQNDCRGSRFKFKKGDIFTITGLSRSDQSFRLNNEKFVPVDAEGSLYDILSVMERSVRFRPMQLEENKWHKVVLSSWYGGPLAFCIQLKSSSKDLRDLMETINQRDQLIQMNPHEIDREIPCLAMSRSDNAIYRAIILKCGRDKRSAKVYFVDYGTTEILPFELIYNISDVHIKPRILSVPCCLAQWPDLDLRNKKLAKSRFEHYARRQLACKIVTSESERQGSSFRTKTEVQLFDEDGSDIGAEIKELVRIKMDH